MARIVIQDATLSYPVIDPAMSFRTDLKNWLASLFGGQKTEFRRQFDALRNISFSLEQGDRLALVGPNGAGKSTLLRVLAGSYVPTRGSVAIEGTVTTLLTAGLGMDMDQTGYENIYTCAMVLDLPIERIDEIRADIIAFCDLGDHIHLPVRTYSSGMLVRLSFAIATAIIPDILLVDEIIGAGDAKFAEKSRQRISKMFGSANIIVLASHSPDILRQYCNKGLFLLDGEIRFLGGIEEALACYEEWITA